MKTNKSMMKTTILTTIVCLLPVIIGIILYPRLPETVVTHWDANGNPNGWQSKFIGTIVYPGILVVINFLFPLLLKIDPKYNRINEKIKYLLHWIIPLVSVFCSSSTIAAALGKDVNIPVIAPMFLGFVFIVIGNYLPKISQNYTVGIKIPWTLNSEENWNRTHRMAGFLWVICGIVIMLTGLLGIGSGSIIVAAFIMVIVPMVYSYLLYRKGV